MRPPSPCERRQSWDLPIPVRGVSVRARGLRPRRVRAPLALSMRTVLPSTNVHSIGTLESRTISRLHSRPVPRNAGSTLHPCSYEQRRMTRGRCGSLHLHRMTLSFTTPRRFSSALSDSGSKKTWQIEGKDLIFRYAQTTEIGCSRGFASCDGAGHRADKRIPH